MGKSEYVQLTIRIPKSLYDVLREQSEKWGTTMQDTVLIILHRQFWGCT